MRDQAGALVRRGRAAQRRGGHREHHHAAILHRLDLLAQQHRLLAGLPRMRHLQRRRLRHSRAARRSAGRCRAPAPAGRSRPNCRRRGRRVRACGSIFVAGLRDDRHAFGGDAVIGELLRLQFAQAGDHLVAERAGGEDAVRLDQRHLQSRDRAAATRARSSRRQSRRRSRRCVPRLARRRAKTTSTAISTPQPTRRYRERYLCATGGCA